MKNLVFALLLMFSLLNLCGSAFAIPPECKENQKNCEKSASTENIYTGSSTSGNISEALELAIDIAKKSLKADHIDWKLISIEGRSGGYILENIVNVSIDADKVEATSVEKK